MNALGILWFVLIGVLWAGYLFLEGFDFGVGILLPFLGKDDLERRTIINSIGPVWDGNEVWLLVAGGATFAAFPHWYASLFSGFYLALFLVLLALIFRGLSFEFRSKNPSPAWRAWWDRALFFGSAIPALLWGVAWADILHGVPIDARGEYVGSFFDLLNPFALVGGIAFLFLFALHGAVFLTLKTTGEIRERARKAALRLSLPASFSVFAFLAWMYVHAVQAEDKGVVPGIVPVAAVGAAMAVSWLLHEKLDGWAFAATGLSIVLLVATIFANLYPRVLVSSIDPAYSLTISNASSSTYTLRVMTIVAGIFTPVVLAYQTWTYWVFRKRVGHADTGHGAAD